MNRWIRKLPFTWSDKSTFFLCFTVILVMGIFLRASFFAGLVFDDSIAMAERSWGLYSENNLFEDFLQFKIDITLLPSDQNLLVLVTGFIYQLIGVNNFSSVIFPIVSSLLVGLLLYVVGRFWFGQSVGLLAMFFWLVLPIGVFISSNLLPALPMITLNTLAVALFVLAKGKYSWFFYVLSGALFYAGFILDWTYFLASAVFVVAYISTGLAPKIRNMIGIGLFAGAILYMLISPNGSTALNLYYLVSLVFENLLLFPLLIIGLVYAGSRTEDERPTTLLIWLAAKSLFLIVGARWIAETPILESIGMSGYWLDLLVPGLLLIAWLFVSTLGDRSISRVVILVNVLILILLLGIQYSDLLPAILFTVSRIFFGLTLLFIAIYLAVWNSSKKTRFLVFFLFLFAFLLGSLTITNDYWRSYRFVVDDAVDVLSVFEAEDEITLLVSGEELFARFRYLNGFEEEALHFENTHLRITGFKRTNSSSIPSGTYVVMTEDYRDFIFGSKPNNWSLEKEIANSDQQKLLLFRVNP